jgi:hypothetical protein
VSRFEGKIGDEGDEAVDAAEILAALARDRESDSAHRREAVSRYLSASDGWEQASDVLGGAFAKCGTWLKAAKEE